jgi:hypothetical protein
MTSDEHIISAAGRVIDRQAERLSAAQRDRGRLLAWMAAISRATDVETAKRMAADARAGLPAPSKKR